MGKQCQLTTNPLFIIEYVTCKRLDKYDIFIISCLKDKLCI